MERICAGSMNLAVDRFGSGPPVVLAGGTGMPAVVWEVCGFVDALVTAGYEVVTYSARGVAPSDAPPAPYTIEEMAHDLAGLIETLALGPCSVIGYSLGGFQAECLARTRPDLLRSVVLLASAGPLTDVLDAVIVTEGELLERLGSIPQSLLVLEGLVGSLPSELLRDAPDQVALWRELLAGQTDVWTSPDGELGQWHAARTWTRNAERMERLSGVEIPVLALAFEQDLKFPPRGARLAVSGMPRGEAVEIGGAAHGGLLTHTHETLERVLSFLRSTAPAIDPIRPRGTPYEAFGRRCRPARTDTAIDDPVPDASEGDRHGSTGDATARRCEPGRPATKSRSGASPGATPGPPPYRRRRSRPPTTPVRSKRARRPDLTERPRWHSVGWRRRGPWRQFQRAFGDAWPAGTALPSGVPGHRAARRRAARSGAPSREG